MKHSYFYASSVEMIAAFDWKFSSKNSNVNGQLLRDRKDLLFAPCQDNLTE